MKWKRVWPGESPPDPLLPTLGIALLEIVLCIMKWPYQRIFRNAFWERRQWERDRRREVEWEDINYCLVPLVPILVPHSPSLVIGLPPPSISLPFKGWI